MENEPHGADSARAASGETPETREVAARRSPRYGRFMVLGAVVLVIVAAIVTYSFPAQQGIDRNAVFGFVGLFAAALGVGIGGVVALLLDRAAARRTGTVRLAREPAPADATLDFPVVETTHTAGPELDTDTAEPGFDAPSAEGRRPDEPA